MDFYILLSEASLKSFDETRLLKIHQKIHFWLYCTCGAAGRQEAGEAGVHFPPKVREHTWWDTAHRHPSPPRRDAWRPTCDCPCSLTIFGLRSCSLATPGRNEELKNLNLSDSLWNLLSNFQNNHSKTKEKSAFLKHAFPWCPPENHREGKKVRNAVFILTFFPRCWHDVSLNSPLNVHTWPLCFTSKLPIHGFLPPLWPILHQNPAQLAIVRQLLFPFSVFPALPLIHTRTWHTFLFTLCSKKKEAHIKTHELAELNIA